MNSDWTDDTEWIGYWLGTEGYPVSARCVICNQPVGGYVVSRDGTEREYCRRHWDEVGVADDWHELIRIVTHEL